MINGRTQFVASLQDCARQGLACVLEAAGALASAGQLHSHKQAALALASAGQLHSHKQAALVIKRIR
jgi:hypothetical protein